VNTTRAASSPPPPGHSLLPGLASSSLCSDHEPGSVLVRYETSADAGRAVAGLTARVVQGRRVRAFLVRKRAGGRAGGREGGGDARNRNAA
jgi:hypothetical protein